MNEYPKDDEDFREVTLAKVSLWNGTTEKHPYWDMTFDDGWSLGVSSKAAPNVTPQVGDRVRCYGKGIGFVVRGVFVNGVKMFYRTTQEEDERSQEEISQADLQKQKEFEENKAKYDVQFESLPEVFRARIVGFRERNEDFRWKFEPYELFCCLEAVKILKHFKAFDELKKFRDASTEEQKKAVPELEYEEHSGNTFGSAVNLALCQVTSDEKLTDEGVVIPYVAMMHGSMCSLVGCQTLGCWSARKKSVKNEKQAEGERNELR